MGFAWGKGGTWRASTQSAASAWCFSGDGLSGITMTQRWPRA
jgi:hypothetical protein